jgi:tetratricopeptide (TPR) repeat protein
MPPERSTAQPPRWGTPKAGPFARIRVRLEAFMRPQRRERAESPPRLPIALRRAELAEPYLAAEASGDHQRAGAAAQTAMERAATSGEWWPADIWGHRAMWHFEQAGMELAATRMARLIGDLRVDAGDPASARRYYAEAISEARDIGAEREEGLAASGLGRAHLQLGDVTTARRLAQIGIDLLERSGAPASEVAAARELRGEEKEAK